jgi:threonine/homoserine/homoserine lactone efflux protein
VTFPIAFAIGFSVASIPGPTIILIATETLRRGASNGLLAMLAPLALDAGLMLPLGLILQASLFSQGGAFALGIIGAAFLFWLGLQSLRAGKMPVPREAQSRPAAGNREFPSFFKGLVTHLTSPFPYIYWGTVGSTFVRQGYEGGGVLAAAQFPLGFWSGAVAFTLMVIYIVARGKRLLPPRWESYLHRFSGTLLIAGGIYLALSVWRGPF